MIKQTLTLLALSSIGGSNFLSNANNKNCLCLPRDYLSIPNSMNGVDTQRLVVYLYKSPERQNIRVHIPNVVKQRLLPDFPVEDDDELIDNDQLTLQGIFGSSKVVSINHKSLYNIPGAQIYPSLNRHLNHRIPNQFSTGVNIPNRHGRAYPTRLNFVNQFTPNIPFFWNFLHNYLIAKKNPENPNIFGDVKITHENFNGPLHPGKFNVPLNIYSEVNSRPNNLINHGIDLINAEGPDSTTPNYFGTIYIKHNYPIQDGINDPVNPNFSGNIKIIHGSINGLLQHSGKLNEPLNIYFKENSRPNNLQNDRIDLINSESPGPIRHNYSGTINIKHDYPIQGGINDPDNPNFSGDIKIKHGSINRPPQYRGKLNVPVATHSEVNSRPNNLINPGIYLMNTEIPRPINPNHSGTINIKDDYLIQGSINDPENPDFSGDIKITHDSFDGPLQHSGNLNLPLNIHSEVNTRPSHLLNPEIYFLNTLNSNPNNPNRSGKIKVTQNFPIAGGITDPDNPNNYDMIKQIHNFPIAGGITDPDNPNNYDMIKQTHNFPIAGGITDPDNPNYTGNSPHDFPVAGGITDLDNFNSSEINITNSSISVPLHNSVKFYVPLNIRSQVNNRPSNLINPGINLINTEKTLDFNTFASKNTIPRYDLGLYIDSNVDEREVNLPGLFHPRIVNVSNDKLQPGITKTSTDSFVKDLEIPLNPVKGTINGSISISPAVNGQFLNLVNVNPNLINEPNNLTNHGVANKKNLDSDQNQINKVTVNTTLNPLHYDENVFVSINEKKISGMIEPDSTLNGKVKISSKSHSKIIDEPNNTLNSDLEITRTEKNKHSSTPGNYVTKIITHEGMNGKLNHSGQRLVPGKFEFDFVSQQINPGKEILSDPSNKTNKKVNFTIPVGINALSDLLHSGGVHHKQLGNIPEVAKDALPNIISDPSRHDNYEFGSFDDWLNHQITSDNTVNIETIKKLTEKILDENGIRINKQGVLISSDGNVFNLTKLKLVPLLIGSPVGYDTIIQNGVIYKNKINLPRNIRYKNSALIAFDDPLRILGIIPLGLSLNTDRRLALDSKFVKLKTPLDGIKIDRTSYLPSTTIKPVALSDLTGKPESPMNYVQNYKRPCTSGNCFSHRIVPGIEQENDRIYPKTNDANTKIIYLNEPTDERTSILSTIKFAQGAGEIIPVVKNMTRLLKKLIVDTDSRKGAKDVTESPKEPEKPPPDYDEVPGFRIIGGNAATSSGTPVSSKGRSGIIT